MPPTRRSSGQPGSGTPFALPREGSLRLLRAGLRRRLVLVQAAVGSGKSTLAGLLARADDSPVVRVRLDPRASDASFFFRQLLPALDLEEEEIDPQRGAPIETVRGLAASLDERPPFVLVLDEAEVLRESEPVLEMVARLAEHAPTGVSLLVLTSAPLDLPVDALRARGEFFELHEADLALEPSEAEALLRELAPGAGLEPDAIGRLLRAVRGRVGAVALFGVAIRDTDPRHLLDEIARAADSPVARLLDHVLARVEPAAADWLEQAAVFDDLSLDAWGEADGASEAASLGLVDLTETPPSLASTVRGALRRRLRARPELWRETHARAARAWEAQGDREQAFHHWIEAGEIERAAQILSAIAYAVLTHDRIYTLERLIQQLPTETIESDPLLRFCRRPAPVGRRGALPPLLPLGVAGRLPGDGAGGRAHLRQRGRSPRSGRPRRPGNARDGLSASRPQRGGGCAGRRDRRHCSPVPRSPRGRQHAGDERAPGGRPRR